MKLTKYANKLAISVVAIFFLVLWAVWYSCYYYTLCWQEGFSFFSTLPDFIGIQANLPEDIFKYTGAFLLQFFRNPLCGAAIQAGFTTFIVIFLGICVKDARLLWLAFLPVPVFVAGQYADITLVRSLQWCTSALLLTVIWRLFVRLKHVNFSIPHWLRSSVLMLGVPVMVLGLSVYQLMKKDNGYQEQLCRIDYHANQQEWREILHLISPEDAQKDELKLRYALLALSETGQLADYAFGYGIKDYSQFLFYGTEDPFHRNFNALFYQSIGMPNEVVHQCYQQSLTSPFGFNFKSLRLLVDTYIEMGDRLLASKYLEILRHSSFHQEWTKSRMERLESMKMKNKSVVKNEASFVGNFLETITSMVNRDIDNRKNMDLGLCAILTTRNVEYFRQAFEAVGAVLYADGKRIPRHYEEALLLIALHDKKILTQYNISKESRERFVDFMQLLQNGKINVAKAKYPNSYWSFMF